MDSDDDYYYSSSDEDTNDVKCTNMDPALAKIMGIFIKEQEECDWKPPLHSGLSNSQPIINHETKSNESKQESKEESKHDDFVRIKEKIKDYDKLTQNEIESMKYFSNQQKIELISIYNNIIHNIINN